ncbi:MAG: CvpA family protein [Planctomycetales bacterium]|nr:CvpA family protein [Planctomycetales bacterium]
MIIGTVLTVLVILMTLAYFNLKCSIMSSLSTLLAAVLATIIAFSWYEWAAELFVSRGYGAEWAHFGCFLLLFVLAIAILRALADLLMGTNVDLGKPAKITAALACGFLTGLILSGILLVSLGMLPMQGKVFYTRFDPEKPVSLSSPKTPLLNADGFVCGLYRVASAGSMSSDKSFGVVHADFLSQIHLNRLKAGQNVPAVNSRKSLVLPSGKDQKPVRTMNIPDRGEKTVVRMGIKAKNIADGGANNGSGEVQFFPAQIRMICKPAGLDKELLRGSGKAIWPAGFLEKGVFVEKKLDEIIKPETKGLKDRIVWMDVVFDVPSGQKGILLQFKQCAMAELPEAVPTTEDIEKALNQSGSEENVDAGEGR